MKLIITVDVPEHEERNVKIADMVDKDRVALCKIALALAALPDARSSVHVEYPQIPRSHLENMGR